MGATGNPSVVLVETAPAGERGSMARYAALVADALAGSAGAIAVSRLNLAPSAAFLRRFPRGLRTWVKHAWIGCAARSRLAHLQADVVHVLDGSHAYVFACPLPGKAVATVHDMIPLLQIAGSFGTPGPKPPARWLIQRSVQGLRRATLLVADSASTRNDLCRLAGVDAARVRVIWPALDHAVSATAGQEVPRANGGLPFVLHVGNDAFYKNRPGVLRVFGRIRSAVEARLVMAGAAPDRSLRRTVRALGLESCVRFVADPDDATLAGLYRTAALLLFPSLYEGFGWPPLEAMASGCPVVCSFVASLPEIVGDAALTAPPADEAALAQLGVSVLRDPALAARLSRAGRERCRAFRAERMAVELVSAYREVAAAGAVR